MTAEKRALANLAESIELPLAAMERAALAPTEDEPGEEEILALAAEFDSYTDSVLTQYTAQEEPSSEQVSALKRYVEGGRATLSSEIRTLLKTSGELRAALRHMIQEIVVGPGSFVLAPVAAASDGDVDQRRFEGGIVTVAPAEGHPTQVYIVVDFDDSKSRARYAILRAEDDTDVARLPLDERFDEVEDGVIQRLVDLENPEVECFVKLFRIPTSRGALLR
jgi:hypothetical protein